MDDSDAVSGLKRLGLTTYEARVFLALQKLGAGTAAEVTEVVDVPRSQVYGAAERLEERGLLETQQTTPTRYRPVSLAEARRRLLDRLEATGAETFEYLETVRETARGEESSEAIWLVRGGDSIAARIADLAADADRRLRYGAPSAAYLDEEVLAALRRAADRGIEVVVASEDAAVREAAAAEPELAVRAIPPDRMPDIGTGRVLLVDEATLLLSVLAREGAGAGTEEVAFWSADSVFSTVLVEVIEQWILGRD